MEIKNSPLPFQMALLPSPTLDDVWRQLIFPPQVPARFLRFLDTLCCLGKQRVSPVALALRRSVLLCGPPGTGKTCLARGGANFWARSRNQKGQLLLVNSHTMASAHHGGTQANVLSLFNGIREHASLKPQWPTFVIVDEVETLASNRAKVNPANNPMDTIHGVNAFLEGLDKIVDAHPNVIFIFTSNLHANIDRAVTERVDFTLLVRLPNAEARQAILRDALKEIAGTVTPCAIAASRNSGGTDQDRSWKALIRLTKGFSARTLRHLIVSGLTFVEGDGPLQLKHLLLAAREEASQLDHHRRSGGMYTHDYELPTAQSASA